MTCPGACPCGPCVVGRRGAERASYVSDGRGWRFHQLGQLGDDIPPGGVEDQPCPPGWPAGIPCVVPGPGEFPGGGGTPSVPGVPVPTVIVTEDEAREREREAYERGAEEERSSFIKYTIIGSVISGVVGFGLAKVLG